MAFADDLIVRLVAQGVGVYGTNIFTSSRVVLPTGTGPYLSVIPTGGTSPLRTQNSVAAPAYQRPSAQLFTRAGDDPKRTLSGAAEAAMAMARAAYNALVGVRNEELNGVYYRELNPSQEPFDAGSDSQGRACVSFNIMGIKRPT